MDVEKVIKALANLAAIATHLVNAESQTVESNKGPVVPMNPLWLKSASDKIVDVLNALVEEIFGQGEVEAAGGD